MKKYFTYAAVVLVVAMPALALAVEFRTGDNPSIGKDEKIVNDVYIAGGGVTSAGNVNGDLITAGGNVVISGDVSMDIFAGGGNISILSNVGDDVRVGGGTVVIAGRVGGDLLIGGGNVNISGPGVGGDAVMGGGNVRIGAPVAGNLLAGGGNIYINAPIGGDVKIDAQKVTLGKNAVITGNLTYKATEEMVKESGAVVKGKVDFQKRTTRAAPVKVFAGIISAFILWKFLALLACALTVGLVLRRYSREIVELAVKRPWFEMGRGVLFMILTPLLSIILLVTLVGIPFGIAGILGFILVMIFAWIMTPVILGSVIYRYFSKEELEISWKTILLGVFIYALLGLVPIIGGLAQALLIFLTLGAMTAFKLRVIKEWM